MENEIQIKAACTRFLSGYRPLSGEEWLKRIATSPLAGLLPDIYGDGAAVSALEKDVAALMGKETGIFIIKGVIAQLAALRVWCDRSGSQNVALHSKSHIELDEANAYERIMGLKGVRLGDNYPFTLKDLQKIPERLGVVTIELPLRQAGFKLPKWEDLMAISEWCRENKVPLHFDGARLWESSYYYDRPYTEIAALADSVYVSFYKGIGGLGGCVLSGSADFIKEVMVWKSRLGGNLFTAFPYVISAKQGLEKNLPRMAGYCARARTLAQSLQNVPGLTVVPEPPHTNAFQLYLPGEVETLKQASLEIARTEKVWLTGFFKETALQGISMAEVQVGEATEALSDEEICTLFQKLIMAQ